MQRVSHQVQRYIAIDMSYEMLKVAQKEQRDKTINKQYIQGDFDAIADIQPHIQGRSLIAVL
jgi:ubiquinone/menaquinone biosynthesis C-methylase UbiE